MTAFLAIDENLRAAMQFFGRASGSGDIADLGSSLAIFSGLDYGVFNIGLLTRRVAEGELESRLNELGRFFRERTLRWSMWVCEDQLDSAVRKRERQIFANCGMRSISQPPGMLARELLPPAYALYSREAAWHGYYQGFVGYVEGKAVSIIALVEAADVIGVYSLATVPGFRRRGYAEAMLRATVGRISARTGSARVVLQSTEAGYALYKRMGFADVTRFTVYLTK
jgi:ribosomal protein S18 acetylase RimI-like enzyme